MSARLVSALVIAVALALSQTTVARAGNVKAQSNVHANQLSFSEGLWEANFATASVAELTPAVAVTTNNSGSLVAPFGIAFDSAGNLWIMDDGGAAPFPATVYEFAASDLANLSANPMPSPITTITYSGFGDPGFIAIDSSDNVWIADEQTNQIYEYASSTVEGGGTFTDQTPDLIMASAELDVPLGLAFDSSGNLWVSNSETNGGVDTDSVLEFAAGDIGGSGTITPSPVTVLSSDGHNSISDPWGLTFDSAGNLWVANRGGKNVAEFAAGDIGVGGAISPTPIKELKAIASPADVAFDSSGDLAVSVFTTKRVLYYSAAQLAKKYPVRKVVRNSLVKEPSQLAFGPLAP